MHLQPHLQTMPAGTDDHSMMIAAQAAIAQQQAQAQAAQAQAAQLAALQQYTGPVTPADAAHDHEAGDGVRSTVRRTWNKARRLID